MAKKICCCTDEPDRPIDKHYIAIPCWEYNSNIYSDISLGIKLLYQYPSQSPVSPLTVAGFTSPIKITGLNGSGNYTVSPDYDRMSRVMLRGGGGGSNTGGSGGNGAYVDCNIVPSKLNDQPNQIAYFIGAGGSGPFPPYDYSVTTTTILSGGPAQPMSGRGGAAASIGPNNTNPYTFFAGGGGGAGSIVETNGGHGGVIEGEDGLGDRPGIGGSQLYGGTAGDTQARRGSTPSEYVGGRGSFSWLPTIQTTLSSTSGGGGGAGWKGGGGGGQKSGGGGGSSSLEPYSPTQQTFPEKIEVVVGADGTDLGPGNRCSPYFTLNYDPGLGGNRKGRYIAGNTFFTPYKGTNSQVSSYYKKRWCIGSENQTTQYQWGSVTGVLSDTKPLHICLDQAQYDTIIGNMPAASAPQQLKGVRLSFELNSQKYILVQINDLNCKDTANHYSCTLSCESNFLEAGTPTNVKFYIPSINFGTIKDSVDWFKANWPTYDFSNVTSCCDKIIGEPICIGGYGNSCTGEIDPNTGEGSGCLCDRPSTPPPKSGDKPSALNGFYIHRDETGWYYLCIPAFGWANFGDAGIVKRYSNNTDPLLSPVLNFTDNLTANVTTIVTTINLTQLQQLYCQEQGGGQNTCTNQQTYWNEEDCKPILLKTYPYRDFYGINESVFISCGGSCCIRGCNGYGWCTRPPRFHRQASSVTAEMISVPEINPNQCSYSDPDLDFCGLIRCGPALCPPVPACCVDPNGCGGQQDDTGPGGGQGGGQQLNTSALSISKSPELTEEENKTIKSFLSRNSSPRFIFDTVLNKFKRDFSYFNKFVYNTETNTIDEQTPFYLSNLNPCGGQGPGQSACSLSGEEQVSKSVTKIDRGCPPACAFALCGLPPWTCGPLCACICQVEVGGGGGIDLGTGEITSGEGGCTINERESFQAELCYAQQKVDKIETTEIFSITLPACLFPDVLATPEQLLVEAQNYIQLSQESKTIQYSFTISTTIQGIMLKMCPKITGNWNSNPFELFIGSAGPEDIVSKINNCLSGISAQLITPELDEKKYYWFGKRFFTYIWTNENNQSFPSSVQKRGDTLKIKRAYRELIGGKVVVVFEAESNEARTFHGAYQATPLTNDGTGGGRGAAISFKDDNPISIREWAAGLTSVNMRQSKTRSTFLGICQGTGQTTYTDELYCNGDIGVDEEIPPNDPDYFDYIGNATNCDYCFVNRIDCYATEADRACDTENNICCITYCDPETGDYENVPCPGSMMGVCSCRGAFCDPCGCGSCCGTSLTCTFDPVWYTGSWCTSGIGDMIVQ